MSSLDYSEALFSGATLGVVQKVLDPGLRTGTAVKNAGVMTVSELLSQYLMDGSSGPIRAFLYRQHGDLTSAALYTLFQEVMRFFGSGGGYRSEWREIFANLFVALGAQELGSQINSALGMAPNSISAASILSLPSSGGGGASSVVSGKSVPKSRMVIM